MEEIQEEMLAKLNFLTDKLVDMETAMKEAARDNKRLQTTVDNQACEIAYLKDCLNKREQYARSWSMLILNIPLPAGQKSNTKVVMDTIYDKLMIPILEGAIAEKEIDSIPSRESLLETAHILPGKGTNKPIIARFHSRYWRSLIFRYRKKYAPREDPDSSNTKRREERAGRMKFSFFEDLTRETFKQLQDVKASQDISSAWTISGAIRFTMQNNDNIFRVTSLLDTVQSLTEK